MKQLAAILLLASACGGSGGAPDMTAPKTSTRFVAVGDTGKGNAGQQVVADAMAKICQERGCDFGLFLGDNIYESGASSPMDPQFQAKFETPYAALDFPIYLALGNHDFGSGGIGNEFDKPDHEVAYSMISSKWRMPARVYHFTEATAELFVTDTNGIVWNEAGTGPDELSGWVAASTATWKIGAGHHMYYSNGPHGDAGSFDGLPSTSYLAGGQLKEFFDDKLCGKLDLYLCGHDHSRQWLEETCQGTELVISGAGAEATPLTGTHPTRFQESSVGFLYITVDGRSLTADFYDGEATMQYTRTLTK